MLFIFVSLIKAFIDRKCFCDIFSQKVSFQSYFIDRFGSTFLKGCVVCFRLDYQRMKFGWGVGVLYNGIKFVVGFWFNLFLLALLIKGFLVQPFLKG